MSEAYRLKLETQAAARLRDALTAEYADDEDLIRDMIEGETNLHWLLGVCATELAAVEGEKEGVEGAIGKLKARLARHCRKADALRAGIEAAMLIADMKTFKTGSATLSIRDGQAKVDITDATALPPVYLTQPAPVPDKRAISAALKSGEIVPGAVLSNPVPALSVRFT